MKTLSDQQYQKFCGLIYHSLGIHFNSAKKETVQAKLDKLLRINNLDSYGHFFELIKGKDNPFWAEFVDEITVHQSSFFRESNHFEFIRSQLRSILDNNPKIVIRNEIRIWSAGCSTGEEAYTLGMVLKEWLPSAIAIKILATDVSSKTLARAQNGIYPLSLKKDMDPYYLMQYFKRSEENYEISSEIKELITFRLFNLMEPFPFKDTFDIIFCRNVMIYFNTEIQQQLVQKFHEVLAPGGLLFIGHSESLLNKQNGFQYLQPTVYQKQGRS